MASRKNTTNYVEIQKLRDEGVPVRELCQRFGLSNATIYTMTRPLNKPSKWRNNGHQSGTHLVDQIFSPNKHAGASTHGNVDTLREQFAKTVEDALTVAREEVDRFRHAEAEVARLEAMLAALQQV